MMSGGRERSTAGPANRGSGGAKSRGRSTSWGGRPAADFGERSGGGGGRPKKKSSSAQKKGSVMRESTWNNMSKGMRMKQYGTTSYSKYKAGKSRSDVARPRREGAGSADRKSG